MNTKGRIMLDEYQIIMHLTTYEKLKNYKTLSDSERDEIIAYIGKCEEEIHRLKTEIEQLKEQANCE